MDPNLSWRIWVAVLVAPLAPVLALTISDAVIVVARGEPVVGALAGITRVGLFVAALSLPVAYLIELLVALPLYHALRKRKGLGPWRVVIVAVAVGALVVPIMLPLFSEGGRELWMIPPGGLAGGGTGCLLAAFAGASSRS